MKDLTSDTVRHRIMKLQEERRRISGLPAEQALDAILDFPDAIPLVHSFPVDDFYFLIHDIGPEDALPIIAMASERQWEYLLDQDVWERDRLDSRAVARWFDLFLRADSRRFVEWLKDERQDIAELFLFRHIDIVKREHDEDPSDFGTDYFTLDDVYYIKMLDFSAEDMAGEEPSELRERMITTLLKKVAETDHLRYQQMLTETTAVIPSEAEEEAYRLKNVRLAEKGFLPFEEAIGIYQPLTHGEKGLLAIRKDDFITDEREVPAGIPFFHLALMDDRNVFVRTLASMAQETSGASVQSEFAALCNMLVVADNKKTRDRKALEGIVRKACGYIGVGLTRIAGRRDEPSLQLARESIERYPLSQIFRAGYSLALGLQQQAREWRKTSWFVEKALPLSFWGEDYMGVVGGLLLKRPLFFDNYKRGVLYRDFEQMSEILESQRALSDIGILDDLLSHLDIRIDPFPDHFLTYKNMLLTLWARSWLDLPAEPAPIDLSLFRRFYAFVFTGAGRSDSEEKEVVIHESVKASFLDWLSKETDIARETIGTTAGHILENLFAEIASEYGRVAAKDLDARYGFLFLLK